MFQTWTDVDLLFGSLKTRGLFLALSSASFSFCALSVQEQKNSLNEKKSLSWLNVFFFFFAQKWSGTQYYITIFKFYLFFYPREDLKSKSAVQVCSQTIIIIVILILTWTFIMEEACRVSHLPSLFLFWHIPECNAGCMVDSRNVKHVVSSLNHNTHTHPFMQHL